MKISGAGLLLGALIALPLSAAEPAKPAPATAAESPKQILDSMRPDLQALETEAVSKGVSMTVDEQTRFWPVFKKFQAEQAPIIDGQIAAVRKYAESYTSLTDQDSAAYVNALLERDQRIHDLRVKYLAEYSKVLPAGKAARVIHISRRIGLAAQAKLATLIPLVH